MTEDNEIRLPEQEPPAEPPHRPDPPYARSIEPQSGLGGCLIVAGKVILVLVIGIFVLAGLVFATCFLAFRR
jgi:hypothetical protein